VHDKSTMGGRTQGSKDTKPRKRSKKTDFQKKKDAENRAKKKAQQESIEECARNLASFRASLLAGGGRASSTDDSIVPPNPNPLPDAVEIHGIPHWTEQLNPGEITAQLDADNDEGDEEATDDAKNLNLPADSVMNIYLQAIQSRVKYEVKDTTPTGEKWLHKHLEENDWWIRKVRAKWLCKELNVACNEPAYYRDVYIWLPEQRWGNIAWPPCPTCLKQDVAAHGFQTNHFGRRVVSMTSNYFIMSRRYICQRRCCQGAPSAVEKRQQRTFMGYNPTSRTHLPMDLEGCFRHFYHSGRLLITQSLI
jgi:hypothetical protein